MSDTEYPHCGCADFWPGQGHHPDCPVRHKFETLERENAAMREAIRDSDAALRKCLNYILRLPLSGSDAECEAMDDAHHALRKIQPFLKP